MKKLITICLFSVKLCNAQIPTKLSKAEKVFGLSKFWQEVNYNFVYLDKIDRQKWDSSYKEEISRVQDTQDDYQYSRELKKFCATLNDGHTNIVFPPGIDSLVLNTMFGKYRLFIGNIDNKAIILRTNASAKDEIPIGSEVIEVNGQKTTDYLRENVLPYVASSSDYIRKDIATFHLLEGLKGVSYNIKIKTPGNQLKSLFLTHEKSLDENFYPIFEHSELLEFKWYPNQIAYVSLNSFQNNIIDSLFIARLPELYKAKGLILDLRFNGGGSTDVGTNILQYLTNDSLLYGARSVTRQNIAAYKAWGKFQNIDDTLNNEWARNCILAYEDKLYYDLGISGVRINSDQRKVLVPTAVLIGHNTASAAEDFLIYAAKVKQMIKIGDRTFGSTGQPLFMDLPGGGSARICAKKDTYPDGKEFVGYGIKPDIMVCQTVSDLLHNKDVVLEKALSYLNHKIQ